MHGLCPDAAEDLPPTDPAPAIRATDHRCKALRVIRNVFGFGGVLNFHIAELFRVKDLTTFQAFDKLRVFMPGDDSNLGVSAGGNHLSISGLMPPLSARL